MYIEFWESLHAYRLIPKADRKKIHEYLFRGMHLPRTPIRTSKITMLMHVTEGVLVAKKDFNLPKHNEIDTKNLFVCLGWEEQ